MELYSIIILLQTLLIAFWVYQVSKNNQKPDFDQWLKRVMAYNPDLSLHDAIEIYIHEYDIPVIRHHGESPEKAMRRLQLQLIENHSPAEGFSESDARRSKAG